jgi:Flp pilus assembly protein TadD
MVMRAIFSLILGCTMALLLLAAPLRAAEPLPPMAGISDSAAKERVALLAALAATKNDAEARVAEDRLRAFWRGFADEQSRRLLDASRKAQLEFDYGHALVAMQELVRHQPDFAEGWNEYGYVLFLAGNYDASLAAIDKVLALEPMHYAALAGKGIILIQQGKDADAQAPLKRALAIDPWLKERNLIGKSTLPLP